MDKIENVFKALSMNYILLLLNMITLIPEKRIE